MLGAQAQSDRFAALATLYRSRGGQDVISRGRRLAEAGDPEKSLAEIFGYQLTPQSRKLVYALEAGGKVLAVGCHDASKTFIGGAYMLAWLWFCQGCLIDEETGEPRGAVLVLVANKADQIATTSWQACQLHGRRAASRGWVLPGFEEAEGMKEVIWRARVADWYIRSQTFQAPAARSGALHVAAGAGLKHKYGVIVHIEEADRLPKAMFRTVEGWKPRCTFAAMNPYNAQGAAYDFIQGREWRTVWFSYLPVRVEDRHPNIAGREVVIQGGCDHETLETEMRTGLCEDRGPYPETDPDAGHHDFVYALPGPKVGPGGAPRPDGIPGHVDAALRVWRPQSEFDAGRLGNFPIMSEFTVFSMVHWRAAVEHGLQLTEPARPPDVVGVDCAEAGPDRFVAVPRWGPGAVELWKRYQAALMPQGSTQPTQAEAVAAALLCSTCAGEGCPLCFDGDRVIYFGQEVRINKTGEADEMARRLIANWGTKPLYRLDASGGGHWVAPAMRRLGCRAELISFGGSEGDRIPGQRTYYRQRSRMYGTIAAALTLPGAVALPPATGQPADIAAGCRVLQWEEAPVTDRRGGKETAYKLGDKLAVKAAVGASPDASDAFAATEGVESGRVVSRRWHG